MLSRIFIQNFALINQLEIHLHKGLQVITGETGAGKSIILGALRLILGERSDAKAISNAESKSIIEAEFVVKDTLKTFFDENDLDFENPSIIRREILPSRKSRAFVNDVPVNLDVLKSLSEKLIDIHSQFETSHLFDEDYQFSIIDGLSDNKKIILDYQNTFQEWQMLKKHLEQLKNQVLEGNKESDYKTFLLNELKEVDLDQVNWEDLQAQLSTQENAGAISEYLAQAFTRMDQEEIGVLDGLNDVRNKLSKVAELSHEFSELSARYESIFLEFKDVLFELQDGAEKIDVNQELLDQLNVKVNTINALFLKHDVKTIDELIELRNQLAGEQSGFAELEDFIQETSNKIVDLEKKLTKLSKKLADNRKKSVPVFEKKMETLLKQLGLEKAKIGVEITESNTFNKFGSEKIGILFQANAGFPLKPIQGAISGGERSRVMLAVKKIIAENSELPTLILDEIDTGVSGRVAEEMGKLMHEMGKDMQLIVISHLAQVAAKGDNNYKVVKQDVSGKTISIIVSLNEEEKLQEIAQLLSGSKITHAAIEQAKQLMN